MLNGFKMSEVSIFVPNDLTQCSYKCFQYTIKSRSISQIVRQELLLRKQLFHALHKYTFKLKIGGMQLEGIVEAGMHNGIKDIRRMNFKTYRAHKHSC